MLKVYLVTNFWVSQFVYESGKILNRLTVGIKMLEKHHLRHEFYVRVAFGLVVCTIYLSLLIQYDVRCLIKK